MEVGYKIQWSDRAVSDFKNIIAYLNNNWSDKEVRSFVGKLDKRLNLIAINPRLFPRTKMKANIRRSVLTKQTVIYYKYTVDAVQIIALFDTRQDPGKIY